MAKFRGPVRVKAKAFDDTGSGFDVTVFGPFTDSQILAALYLHVTSGAAGGPCAVAVGVSQNEPDTSSQAAWASSITRFLNEGTVANGAPEMQIGLNNIDSQNNVVVPLGIRASSEARFLSIRTADAGNASQGLISLDDCYEVE